MTQPIETTSQHRCFGHFVRRIALGAVAFLFMGCGTWVGNPDSGDDEKKANPDVGSSAVASLDAVPNLESFLQSSSATIGLSVRSYSLVSGTPPNFVDIATHMATYLTGDAVSLVNEIKADQTSKDWPAMKGKLSTFFEAETKCAAMEHTARIVERLKADSAGLCLLQAIGPVGDKVYRVVSGDPIRDLTKVFAQGDSDRVLQIGMTDGNQPKFEIVQIKGKAQSPQNFEVVYTTCLTASKKAFQQHTLKIDNTTGTINFGSISDGQLDDKGPKPNNAFSLVGSLQTNGDAYVPDPKKAREITYNESGLRDLRTGVAQAALKLIDNEMSAAYFAAESGTDKDNRSLTRTDKTALDVQYTGSQISDLVVYQGASRSVIGFTTTNDKGEAVANADDRIIAFDFDESQTPHYTTSASSAYRDNIAAIDFATHPVLSQEAPLAPDIKLIDSSPCAAAPTTVLSYVDKPEEDGTYRQARTSCNAEPAGAVAKMCNELRDLERAVNDAMNARKIATGSAMN